MNKKLFILMLLVIGIFLTGCEKGANTNGQSDKNESINKGDNVVSGEITMEQLMAAPESPVEDFEITEYEEGKAILLGYLGDDEIVVIPESLNITHIEKYTFSKDCGVKAIRLSNTVQVLHQGAFGLNENLQLFVSGTGLVEIGAAVFQSCTNLREVVLNHGLLSIKEFAFGGLPHVNSIEIPASVTEMSTAVFFPSAEGFTIIGEAGSYAEQYAREEGIFFQAK